MISAEQLKRLLGLFKSSGQIMGYGQDGRLTLMPSSAYVAELFNHSDFVDIDLRLIAELCKTTQEKYGFGGDIAARGFLCALLELRKKESEGWTKNDFPDWAKRLTDKLAVWERSKFSVSANEITRLIQNATAYPDIAKDLLQAFNYTGLDGSIQLKRGFCETNSLKTRESITFDAALGTAQLKDQARLETIIEKNNPLIFLFYVKPQLEFLAHILNYGLEKNRSVVIIGPTPTSEIKQLLLANTETIQPIWLIPSIGNEAREYFYRNLAHYLNGKILDQFSQVSAMPAESSGTCNKLVIDNSRIDLHISKYEKFKTVIKDSDAYNPQKLWHPRKQAELKIGSKTKTEGERRYFEAREILYTLLAAEEHGVLPEIKFGSEMDLCLEGALNYPAPVTKILSAAINLAVVANSGIIINGSKK